MNRLTEYVNLLDVWKILLKRKKTLFLIIGVTTVLALAYCLSAQKSYRAEAVILPLSGKDGDSLGVTALVGQLVNMGGGGAGMNSSTIRAILNSRSLAMSVIEKFNLMPVLYPDETARPSLEMAAESLLKRIQVQIRMEEKTLVISAIFSDPKIAADLVKQYLEGLNDFIHENALTLAKKNRLFVHQQLMLNKKNLLEAGKQLNSFYQGDRISSTKATIDVSIFESLSNAYSNDLVAEEVNAKLAPLSSGIVKDVPQQIYLEYLSTQKGILNQTDAYLSQQYEMAKIEEQKNDPAFQIIDNAIAPRTHFQPKRKLIMIISFVLSSLFGFVTIFLMELRSAK